jgi:hypothetical protein
MYQSLTDSYMSFAIVLFVAFGVLVVAVCMVVIRHLLFGKGSFRMQIGPLLIELVEKRK